MNKYLADIATLPADVRRAWRTDGAHGIWLELAERTVFRVARSAEYDIYERELATVSESEAPAGIQVRMLAPSEHARLDALLTSRRRGYLGHTPAQRTVFAALRGDEIVGYSWWNHIIDSALDFSPLVLPVDAVFHGFVHVARSERHRGLANTLFGAGERYFFEHGIRACWFLLHRANVAGLRAARNRWGNGSRHIARLTYRKLPFRTTRSVTLIELS